MKRQDFKELAGRMLAQGYVNFFERNDAESAMMKVCKACGCPVAYKGFRNRNGDYRAFTFCSCGAFDEIAKERF